MINQKKSEQEGKSKKNQLLHIYQQKCHRYIYMEFENNGALHSPSLGINTTAIVLRLRKSMTQTAGTELQSGKIAKMCFLYRDGISTKSNIYC